jgi:hypothetical protein
LKANDMYKANFKPSSKARLAPCLNDVIATWIAFAHIWTTST